MVATQTSAVNIAVIINLIVVKAAFFSDILTSSPELFALVLGFHY
jgi:hypothetical protein